MSWKICPVCKEFNHITEERCHSCDTPFDCEERVEYKDKWED